MKTYTYPEPCGRFLLKDNSMICDGSTGEWFGNAYCKEIMCGLPQPIPGALSMCMGASALKPDCTVESARDFRVLCFNVFRVFWVVCSGVYRMV